MAKALGAYAVHSAKKKLEHELEIVGATIAAGTALAIFTAGISEGAALAAAATVTELADTLGVAVSTEIATIAGTTLATAAFAGIESVTVDLAVTQPIAMATGEQRGGLNLDEAQDAGVYGALTGGVLGGAGATYQAARAGGFSSFFDGIDVGKATYNKAISRYEINGRTYGVEDAGRTFPDSGTGIAKLDANEYAALQQIVKAKGDLSAAPQLSRNPRFTNNPGIVEKALAIYNGTYR